MLLKLFSKVSQLLYAGTALIVLSHSALALQSSSGMMEISGVVPAVMTASMDLRKEALVFNSGEHVRDRVVGQIHLRYNVPLDAIHISSNRPGGIPAHDVYGPYPFGPYGFALKLGSCAGINPNLTNPISFSSSENKPTDIGSKQPLETGVDVTCDVLASWDGAEDPGLAKQVTYSVDYSVSLAPTG